MSIPIDWLGEVRLTITTRECIHRDEAVQQIVEAIEAHVVDGWSLWLGITIVQTADRFTATAELRADQGKVVAAGRNYELVALR